MNTIRIITTKGCEGCRIATNLVNKAIVESGYSNIKVEIIDCLDDRYRSFLMQQSITDFPAIVFMNGQRVLTKHIGTIPVQKLITDINTFFQK